MSDLPTIDEVALGAFLHDAGKLLQRGMGPVESLPERVRGLTEVISPVYEGRHSHWHVLYTELLFHDLAEAALAMPGGLDRERVRAAAVHHHRPDSARPWTCLVQAADRLSSGMDRKAKDVADEALKGPQAFRRQALRSVLAGVKLDGRAVPQPLWLRPRPADAETIVGTQGFDAAQVEADYVATVRAFRAEFRALCRDLRQPADILHEGMIALGERFWWAVPSSTVDEPDVPLLDHSLSVAAFAACLHAHHAERDELADERAIRNDGGRARFRLLRGDLSGIQATLFRLAAQQVKGVNRILRARSFLMGQLVDAAALLVRRELGLPPYVVLMRAGGQFTMLLPEVERVAERVRALQGRIDGWMARTYAGELGLVLCLSGPLADRDFARAAIGGTLDRLGLANETAKQRALAGFLAAEGSVLKLDYEEGADGACPACGVRPARLTATVDEQRRCVICHHEHEIGQDLPRLQQCLLLRGAGEGLMLFDEVRLVIRTRDPFEPGANLLSAWKPRGCDLAWPVADRWIANHVPRFRSDPAGEPAVYKDLPPEPDGSSYEPGDLKTMAHLAADARDVLADGQVVGRAMLGVLKADVDNLGQLFRFGLDKESRSIGRLVALSRTMDAFFTGRLPRLLADERFADTYMVYAGGDDLLLIGPWRQMLELAGRLRAEFAAYSGGNPSLTLSAGIELVDAREALNRSADRAEALLEQAKQAPGKDRVACLGEVLDWDRELPWLLGQAEELCRRLRAGTGFSTALVYKLLHFAEQKRLAELGDTRAAIWRAHYQYMLARQFPQRANFEHEAPFFHGLMGLLPDSAGRPSRQPTRAALSIALWRNR